MQHDYSLNFQRLAVTQKKTQLKRKGQMNWITFAVGAAVMWGVAYTLLVSISQKVNPFVINIVYGIVNSVINTILLLALHQQSALAQLSTWSLWLLLLLYSVCLASGGILFLLGYKATDVIPAAFLCVSNVYPIITLVLSEIFFPRVSINYYFVVPGVALTLGGVCLLAFA